MRPMWILLVVGGLGFGMPAWSSGSRPSDPPSIEFPSANVELSYSGTDIKDVYRDLAARIGINVLFDAQVRDSSVTLKLSNVTLGEALDRVLLVSQHYYKPLDEGTIIVIPDNQTKRRQYDDLVIQTFYLSWANVNEVQQLIQRLINTRFMSTSRLHRSITLRDTRDKAAIAERLLRQEDRPPAEVEIAVEVFEAPASEAREARVDGLRSSQRVRRLGQAVVSVIDGNKMRLSVGRRLPLSSGGSREAEESTIEYKDVGILVALQPDVSLEGEISLSLLVEASRAESVDEQDDPELRFSRLETVLTIGDGETRTVSGLRGLASDDDDVDRSLVVALTPRLLRPRPVVEGDQEPLVVGTEENLSFPRKP